MNIEQLRKKQILELCKTLLEEYLGYLEKDELQIVTHILNSFDEQTSLKECESMLTPIVRKIWGIELEKGDYTIISWNKYSSPQEKKPVTFATISKKDKIIPFCGCTNGTEYKITFDAILGACPKDGATLIENKQNEYTVGFINNKFINSYNGASKLITPIQLVQNGNTGYPSNHNEMILDSRYAREIDSHEINNNIVK